MPMIRKTSAGEPFTSSLIGTSLNTACRSQLARAIVPDGSRMARETLSAQRNLFDPVWGGVYQYSTDGDWKHPHYEKLLQFQAENLRIYSLAYARWDDPQYLEDARQIRRYMQDFLTSPEGVFYTSQDADLVPGEHSEGYFALGDQERRQQGIPRVDTHIYSRENGWAIQALATLYAVTGEPETLQRCGCRGRLDHQTPLLARGRIFP